MRQNNTATSRQPIPAAIVIFCADQEPRKNLTEALREDAAVAVVGVRDNTSSLQELIVSNKAIARRLGISFHTVKFHVTSVLAKLDADTRTEAVAKAAQLGLVML